MTDNPVDIGRELDALDAALTKFAEARAEIEYTTAVIASAMYVAERDRDWCTTTEDGEPDHVWLNAFRCISPTDEFAAEVGREVIRRAMSVHPKRASLTINAS